MLVFICMVCEEFLHTFHMKICTDKTHWGMELLCSCSLTSKGGSMQCNVMKFTKILMCCVHLEVQRHGGKIITHHDGM
jgi:hypothetical protein